MQFLEACLAKFDVGIWSSKCGVNEGKALFTKFIGTKKKEIEDRIKFCWFTERCTRDNKGKMVKNMENVWEEFLMKNSKSNTSMFVLEGEHVQVHPSKNYIFETPYNIISTPKGDNHDLIRGIWNDLSIIDHYIDIKTFISSFKRKKH